MKNDMLKKILQLTPKDKEDGIYIDTINQKIYLRTDKKPKDFTGEYKEWWDNGQLWKQYFYKKGKRYGGYKTYTPDGQIFEQCDV